MQSCIDGRWTNCEGEIEPTEELCTAGGIDEDCDVAVDEGCDCVEGDERSCGTDEGICAVGTQECIDGAWDSCWSEIEPQVETCDGSLDDDCDGAIDEGCDCTIGTTRSCGSDEGVCRPGTQRCGENGWGECSGGVMSSDELCDSLDNDCDGESDEGIDLMTDRNNCRACGRRCLEACEAGVCVSERAEEVAYLKGSDLVRGDAFGSSVAISRDGSTIAVGAPGSRIEDRSAPTTGAVYIFRQSDGVWRQHARLVATNAGAGDGFGTSIALSGDGNTVAVGAPYEDSSGEGVHARPSPDDRPDSGAVYVFDWNEDEGRWLQNTYIKASVGYRDGQFGTEVELSDSGRVLAIGAELAENPWSRSGVYLYERPRVPVTAWELQHTFLVFFSHFALSPSGRRIIVSYNNEDARAYDLEEGRPTEEVLFYGYAHAGYVWNFGGTMAVESSGWVVTRTEGVDGFEEDGPRLHESGYPALDHAGRHLLLGDPWSWYLGAGINIDRESAELAPYREHGWYAGALTLFGRSRGAWIEEAYIKPAVSDDADGFGAALALSGDGRVAVVGAPGEDSIATGVDGDRSDNTASGSGAAYVFAILE